DAGFLGSTGGIALNKPIVGMAPTPSGLGYWLVASDGGVFAFGDAAFHGSTGNLRLNQPIVGLAPTPSGGGYWFVASDGGAFAFGDAGFHGSTGSLRLNSPIAGITATPTGRGYWFAAADGGIFSFGDADFRGSAGGRPLAGPVTALAALPPGATRPTLEQPPAPAPSRPAEEQPPADPADPGTPTDPTLPPPPPPAPGPAFEIGLLGDTGYSESQEEALLKIRRHMNTFPLASTMHIGDIWSEGHSCSDASYREVRSVFDGFASPFLYTPGDNEWTDCGENENERLESLRRIFFPDDFSLGQTRMPVTRQHPTYVENARWTHSGVVFATMNRPGASDSGGRSSRRTSNLEWLHAAFDQAEATAAPAVVIGFQDNPFEPSGGSFMRALKERTVAFGKPVLLVHGDTHDHRINQPWKDVPNFTRLEVFGDTSSGNWDRVIVDPANPDVFTFDTMKAR
ncbi:MAG TPA: hypothetical protein VI854_04200, partial [Acidimicrobiia bacterium]|nr:hypothetical protein [Acidimicrobiia bacterium]